MIKRVIDFNKEPVDKEKELQMITAYFVIQEKLSDEDIEEFKNRFLKYKEDCELQGKKYIPAYLWFLQNIKVSID